MGSAVLDKWFKEHLDCETRRSVAGAGYTGFQRPRAVDFLRCWKRYPMGSLEVHRAAAHFPRQEIRHKAVGRGDRVGSTYSLVLRGLLRARLR